MYSSSIDHPVDNPQVIVARTFSETVLIEVALEGRHQHGPAATDWVSVRSSTVASTSCIRGSEGIARGGVYRPIAVMSYLRSSECAEPARCSMPG